MSSVPPQDPGDPAADELDPITLSACRLAACRAMIEERRRIGGSFGFALCGAPAWDMLLELYLSTGEARSTYSWALCLSANAPISTAYRKLQEMATSGLIDRAPDPTDHRRILVTPTPRCRSALDALMDRRCHTGHGAHPASQT